MCLHLVRRMTITRTMVSTSRIRRKTSETIGPPEKAIGDSHGSGHQENDNGKIVLTAKTRQRKSRING